MYYPAPYFNRSGDKMYRYVFIYMNTYPHNGHFIYFGNCLYNILLCVYLGV